MKCIETRLDGETRYSGVIVNIRLDRAQLENGKIVRREVVEHPGGVGILPLDDEGCCYMVRQFRYPFSRQLLEIPAGKLERGEDPLECAVRELSEETGFTADEMISMGKCLTSPGISTETLYLYLARGLHAGKAHLDEGEFLNVEKYPLSELIGMAERNELEDGKTIIAVLKAQRLLSGND
ncbi:MAG: NUDIX hydrolase [Oscillospiraceae bacterium]|nr:NUDIX hydrolase [Oscillospiraceae bacterium]